MSNTKDMKGENGEIDLLALLYPDEDLSEDLDGSEHGDFGEDLGDSQGGEFDELLGLRSLFSAMPDEEPSDAVSNRLLALAATHAPKPTKAKSEGGLWAWFGNLIMPLATHPGLAAAASLVLVAGVAGTLYYKNGGHAAEPLAKSAAQDPSRSTPSLGASAIEESRMDSEPSSEAVSKDPAEAAPVEKKQASEGAVEFESDLNELPVASDQASDIGATGRGSRQQFVGGNDSARPSPSKVESPSKEVMKDSFNFKTPAPAKRRERKPSISEDSNRDEAPQIQKKNKSSQVKTKPRADRAKAEVPPAPPPSGPKFANDGLGGDLDDAGESPDDESSLDSKTVSTTKASALHSQAKIAAKKGDCTAVLRLGRQIQKLDSTYYRRQFLADSSLRACRKSATSSK